ncbi:arginase family protein [Fictibacillus aquaticus]|uniref:Arginase n=1 Tax=Fictibacillus aquaticus TaxID=2021314 RepID=A0A235FDP6_9BACL|nr:arginase family protein [Fictibacillus aquaticus]OYD59478.1 hypothetical protein CGZ90_06195 [Fictibacillus aquaticus]
MKFIRMFGVPSSSGSLYSGTDLAPDAFRKAGLREALARSGFAVEDRGDILVPALLPKHNCAPIRNWPAPRMVWEAIIQEKSMWANPEDLTLMIGGDCSIIIGTAGKFYQRYKQDTHLLVIDAHIDEVKPKPDVCVGAAAMGLWVLTNDNVFWNEKVNIPLPQITVMGCSDHNSNSFSIISLKEIKEKGASAAAQRYLTDLPQNAAVLLHFDVDVIDRLEMNAAYAPAAAGLTLQETKELLQPLLADSRIRFVEVTEFSGLRDPDGEEAAKIVKLLKESFSARIVQHV